MEMSRLFRRVAIAALACLGSGGPALAQERAEAIAVEVKPILDLRLRHERVEQPNAQAFAFTLRARAGAEARFGAFTLLAEGEATLAPVADYNAFPFAAASGQRRPQFAVVPDPENIEMNRLQLQYKAGDTSLTFGRQRINLDDQRWVGSVGWRQNEQTFDAVRGEARLGPIGVDLTYAISQRTIFGADAGPRVDQDGSFVFAGLSAREGPMEAKLFAYIFDYDEALSLANSSQTYGGILSGAASVTQRLRLALRVSYARQSNYGANPFDYAADYWALEGSATLSGFTLAAGWEQLGSDNGRAVQTPMATLHRFNGWADLFLTTPPAGLRDAYISVSSRFDGVRPLPGLNATIAFHQFDSAVAGTEYGTEWDASVGFRLGRVGILLKYADYDAGGFGADTRKFWLQAEWSY